MSKIKKQLNIPIVPDTATERMEKRISELSKKYGLAAKNLNLWITSGFMLSELGGAVAQSWVALDEDGELDNMTDSEKAEYLIFLLQRVVDKHNKTVKPAGSVPDNVSPEPEKKTLKNLGTDYG